MSQDPLYPVPENVKQHALYLEADYQQLYEQSINEPELFWRKQAQRLDWIKPFTEVKDVSFAKEDLHIRWFADGTLNASVNCLDRHLAEKGEQTAIIWEPDEESDAVVEYTYRELHAAVCQLANGLKSLGITKGDVVTIYLPMIPEAIVAMLACARIGAVHSVVFAGFSPEALAGRLDDGESKLLITFRWRQTRWKNHSSKGLC
ncbi:Acetyl-coenzyme A synthetase [gamma proteobacterium IMCC2047]|nr:Acetyl-coenzyme A synthetase [gamma proteobacterium IMCC2047]